MESKNNIVAAFNSPAIEKRLGEIKNRKEKNTFLESIMTHPSAAVLNETNGHKTILFAGNKGPKSITWTQTKKMAFELNTEGVDVAFLPELEDDPSTDSLLKNGKNYWLADFKFCVTTKSNTLSKELLHGFEQARTLVLKLENMDFGIFKEAINYLKRNEISYGDILLMNEYGKVIAITYKDIKSGKYIRKTKGFL